MLALAIGLAALVLRLAVPAGYMPTVDQGRLALTICPDSGPVAAAPSHDAGSPDSGGAHHDDGRTDQAKGTCAFADLATPAVRGPDVVLPSVAPLADTRAGLFLPGALPSSAGARLRPPSRGPPLHA